MRHNLAPDELFDRYFLQSVVQHATYLLDAEGSGFYFWDTNRRRATLIAKHNLDVIPWDNALPQRTVLAQKVIMETFPSHSCQSRLLYMKTPGAYWWLRTGRRAALSPTEMWPRFSPWLILQRPLPARPSVWPG